MTRCTIGNFASLHEGYMETISAYNNILTAKHLHWCKENEEIERLRQDAEDAVGKYMRAMSSVYHNEEREITEQLLKKKSIF